MLTVLQLTRQLTARPEVPAVAGVRLRHYAGPPDAEIWLALRRQAFARQRVGVGDWDAADFAREFLEKSWWRPGCMWFAEVPGPLGIGARAVGTITLARRGAPPADKPVVHWLAVLPGDRRRGIGRMLMAALEQVVWNSGERQVWLETHSAWAEAARLYRALGYEPAS